LKGKAEIFAAMANRLGNGHLKMELEDLSLDISAPQLIKKIRKIITPAAKTATS
jgi:(p)ppGpp synthase/HD superfamily hydrolase